MEAQPTDPRATLDATHEVWIETGPDGAHRTVIWVVVDDRGRILVRSVRGNRGRWYRAALRAGAARLHTPDLELPVRVEKAADPERIEACSAGLRRKYREGASLRSMLRPEVLDTTLELTPA